MKWGLWCGTPGPSKSWVGLEAPGRGAPCVRRVSECPRPSAVLEVRAMRAGRASCRVTYRGRRVRSAPFLSGGRHLRPERSPFPRVAHAAHSGLLAPGGPWRCHTQASANVKSTHARPRAPARPRRTEAAASRVSQFLCPWLAGGPPSRVGRGRCLLPDPPRLRS